MIAYLSAAAAAADHRIIVQQTWSSRTNNPHHQLILRPEVDVSQSADRPVMRNIIDCCVEKM